MPPNNQLEATSLLSQIPLGALIGAPLKAAVDAQAAAALACYDFITAIGFENEPTLDANGEKVPLRKAGQPVLKPDGQPVYQQTGKVRDIKFQFERQDATDPDKTEKVSITVPLLTIMPLPFIRIESMTVNFKTSISAVDTHAQTDTSGQNTDLKADAAGGWGLLKLTVGGAISSKKDSTATNTSKYSVEHTMDISLHAVQDDMPAGLAKILSIMTGAIAVNRVPQPP